MHPDEDLRNVGHGIRRAREARALSQEKLAELAGLHRNYVGLLERGERNPRLSTLIAVARALEITLAEVVGDLR